MKKKDFSEIIRLNLFIQLVGAKLKDDNFNYKQLKIY